MTVLSLSVLLLGVSPIVAVRSNKCEAEFAACSRVSSCRKLLETAMNQGQTGSCECYPASIEVDLTVAKCQDSSHDQDGYMHCEDIPLPDGAVGSGSRLTSDADINQVLGNRYLISSQSGKINPRTEITIYDGSHPIQRIAFVTSCSRPLAIGDNFGAISISKYTCFYGTGELPRSLVTLFHTRPEARKFFRENSGAVVVANHLASCFEE
eukprot:c18394_g1_i1.p1 GENE.c18394_g1_i1~~c18394_g1_i1.p1  ORF type:complete len:227 (+),score=36.18 c18394_g1_i1:53-682(+)